MDTQITLQETQHKWYSEIPNLIDDSELSPYAIRLYLRIRRRAGDKGACWESTANLAQSCKMSTGMITKAKRELEEAGFIEITEVPRTEGGYYHKIIILDIWAKNAQKYSDPQDEEEPRSYSERARSYSERARSPGERKNNHIKNNHNKKNNLINSTLEEPELEPCDIDGIPDSWKNKPAKKEFITAEEKMLGDNIAEILNIKPPLMRDKKEYAYYTITWWKPIKEMLRQVDGNVEKAISVVKKATEKLRGRNYIISSPQGLLKTYISCLVNISETETFYKTPESSEYYQYIKR